MTHRRTIRKKGRIETSSLFLSFRCEKKYTYNTIIRGKEAAISFEDKAKTNAKRENR
jgi:hypothetical protein